MMSTIFLSVCCHFYIFFGEMFIQALCPFLIGSFVFLLLSHKNSLSWILDINPLSDMWFALTFSHLYIIFYFLTMFFAQKLILMKSNSALVFFCCLCFGVRKQLPNPWWWRFTPVFSSKNFIVWAFIFKALIYFELFLFMLRGKGQLHSLACVYPLVPVSFAELTILFPLNGLAPLLESSWPEVCRFISVDSQFHFVVVYFYPYVSSMLFWLL